MLRPKKKKDAGNVKIKCVALMCEVGFNDQHCTE